MKYGVTSQGFQRKRLPEQLQEIFTTLRSEFGEETELSPDTVLGVLAANEAERFATIWELAESIYSAMYPMSATGANLDRAVSFTGVKRLPAQPSAVDVAWYGQENTVIPEYTAVRNIKSQEMYYSVGELTLNRSRAYDVEIAFKNSRISTGEVLQVTINGVQYRYQTDRSSIQYAIEQLGNRLKVLHFLSVVTQGNSLRLRATTVSGFSLDLSQNLVITSLGCLNEAQTEGASTDLAEVGQVSELITRIDGLESVNNVTQGTKGREMETDAELYARYQLGVYQTGAGTVESLLDNLLKVKGVSSAFVYENTSNTQDQFSTPANAIHCVVQGGLDSAVAQAILTKKPAGIPTHGNTTVSVTDSQNISRAIKFSRPRRRYIWIKVSVNTFVDQGEPTASGHFVSILNNLMKYGDKLQIGSDVVLQRLMAQCVSVNGVNSVSITIGSTNQITDSEPHYQAQDIQIAPDEIAVFDKTIITIG
ncbi:baseplate J/gp47 family protein [Pasteurellaceae bacterium 22721_9_1]